MNKKWLSQLDRCDFCNESFADYKVFYDCKTIYGPWAILCPDCYKRFGVGLGTGKGQKYDSITNLKLEG